MTVRNMREEMNVEGKNGRTGEAEVKEKEKIHDLLVFEDDGEEFKLLKTEMSPRGSKKAVKMQEHFQMINSSDLS